MYSQTRNHTTLLLLSSLFVALMAVCAYIRIPLPSMVPISLQTLCVYLMMLLLPPRYSLLSMGVYLMLGLLGLPVFTGGGGIGYVAQPSFGFLMSFLLVAPLGGWLFARLKKRIRSLYAAALCVLLLMSVLMYAIGIVYMWTMINAYGAGISFMDALVSGCVVFLPGDALKITCCLLVAPRILRMPLWARLQQGSAAQAKQAH
ncbi:MAG: biotin transporter BioY [Christensenellales bacterium]|jgi:biotin transport system substrate-specific component